MLQLKDGTPYIVKSKRTGNKFIVHDRGKVFLHRSPDRKTNHLNLMAWDSDGNWVNHKQILSQLPQLHPFFYLDYSFKEKIKYNMGVSKEEKDSWLQKKNPFSVAVYKVMNNRAETDSLYDFLGDDVEEGPHAYSYGNDKFKNVEVGERGVTLTMDYDTYKEDIVMIGDDDWYFDYATGHYYDSPYEELDNEELNYVYVHVNKENVEKTNQVLLLLGEETKSTADDWDEGEWAEFFETHFEDEFNNVSGDMLYDLGYGLGRERVKSVQKEVSEELIFPAEIDGNEVTMYLSYPQLLWIIHVFNVPDFTKLMDGSAGFNELDIDLNELWFDIYDYDDESIKEFNWTYGRWLDKLLEKEGMANIIGNRKELISTLKKLGFKDYRYGNQATEITDSTFTQRGTLKLRDDNKEITILSFDTADGSITFKIHKGNHDKGTLSSDADYTNTVPLSSLADYVYTIPILVFLSHFSFLIYSLMLFFSSLCRFFSIMFKFS